MLSYIVPSIMLVKTLLFVLIVEWTEPVVHVQDTFTAALTMYMLPSKGHLFLLSKVSRGKVGGELTWPFKDGLRVIFATSKCSKTGLFPVKIYSNALVIFDKSAFEGSVNPVRRNSLLRVNA